MRPPAPTSTRPGCPSTRRSSSSCATSSTAPSAAPPPSWCCTRSRPARHRARSWRASASCSTDSREENDEPDACRSPGRPGPGWSLLHFVWQGTAVAALLASLTLVLRRAAPQVRYLLAGGALLLMLLLPITTFFVVRGSAAALRPEGTIGAVPEAWSVARTSVVAAGSDRRAGQSPYCELRRAHRATVAGSRGPLGSWASSCCPLRVPGRLGRRPAPPGGGPCRSSRRDRERARSVDAPVARFGARYGSTSPLSCRSPRSSVGCDR